MKNRVNLFPAELKPKLKLFTVGAVLLSWALSGIILFSVSQSYQATYDDFQASTKSTQNQYNNQKRVLDSLTDMRDNRAQDAALLAAVEKLQSEVRDKKLLLDELRGREQLKNQGFSTLMFDLAESHVPDIWLTRISINESKIRLEGSTLESSKVPLWVSNLRDSSYFAGRSFAGAKMFRDDEDDLNFVISSDLVELALEQELSELGGGQP